MENRITDTMHAKLSQQIVKVKTSAETNRPKIFQGTSKKGNQSVVSIDLIDSDDEIEVKKVNFNYYLPRIHLINFHWKCYRH